MNYIPKELKSLNSRFKLIKLSYEKVLGADKRTETDLGYFFANFKSYGGSEKEVNGVLVIEDTATIVTHFRPDIQSDCLIERDDGSRYEILNDPENIELRNIALKFKVRKLKSKNNG